MSSHVKKGRGYQYTGPSLFTNLSIDEAIFAKVAREVPEIFQNFPKFQNYPKNCHETSLFREKDLKIFVTVAKTNGSAVLVYSSGRLFVTIEYTKTSLPFVFATVTNIVM